MMATEHPDVVTGDDVLFMNIAANQDVSSVSWERFRREIITKLDQNIQLLRNSEREEEQEASAVAVDRQREGIIRSLNSFQKPPWTIQRLCELLLNPKQYQSTVKYLRAIEKTSMVTSSYDEFSFSAGPTTAPSSPSQPLPPLPQDPTRMPPLSQTTINVTTAAATSNETTWTQRQDNGPQPMEMG